ncbi:MAG: hypothetical protein CM1200mP12_09300 [Gammaproteobacteria bacterium]|nr:MAG: hypothetical protein CM1200mP12_09300 [Gammaproteobacteria bacterium]
MIAMDPPQHTVYRKMVSPKFSPRSLKDMEDGLRNKVKELLDEASNKRSLTL